jgi:hypothetical protein
VRSQQVIEVPQDQLELACRSGWRGRLLQPEAEPERFRAAVRVWGELDDLRIAFLPDMAVAGIAVGDLRIGSERHKFSEGQMRNV